MIIRFFDKSNYQYPLISIWGEDLSRFRDILAKYREEDTYNFEGFLETLREKGVTVKELEIGEEIYF